MTYHLHIFPKTNPRQSLFLLACTELFQILIHGVGSRDPGEGVLTIISGHHMLQTSVLCLFKKNAPFPFNSDYLCKKDSIACQ